MSDRQLTPEEIAEHERRELAFREFCCRDMGLPLEDYEWGTRREQLRNWQKLRLPGREARRHDGRVALFCPRCGTGIQWFSENAPASVLIAHDTAPLKSRPNRDAHCGDCNEHFRIDNVPSPYEGAAEGWQDRRRIAIARQVVGALRPQMPRLKGKLAALFSRPF